MIYSSYQVERLIDRLRRLSDWLPWPAYRRWRGAERVRIRRVAAEAAEAARGVRAGAAPPAAGPPPSVAAVRAGRRYPPLVEEERERRAGSFMRPPYPDASPSPHIPRTPRGKRRRRPRAMAEG